MNTKEAIRELKNIYDCLNVKNIEDRATLYETYSRLLQVAKENKDVEIYTTGRVVTTDVVFEQVKLEWEEANNKSEFLFNMRETLMMINPKIELHYVDLNGIVKDLQTEVLGYILDMILLLATQ